MNDSSLVSFVRRLHDGTSTMLCLASASLALAAPFLTAAPARAVTIDWVTVGNPGNAASTSPAGFGAVAESFQSMKFEWTNSQYVDFLNSVDPNGTNPNSIYNLNMGSNARGGISFNTNGTTGGKYAAKTDMGDKPVNYVTWFDAARVANWLHNGQGAGDTETGAYTLNGVTSGTAPARNAGAQYWIPTEDQWFKAAYYKGSGTNAGYWSYATQTDTAPTPVTADSTGNGSAGSTGNFANFVQVADWNSQNGNVTTVGTNGGPSAYATFDMSGNVAEWNDLTAVSGTTRGMRGGSWIGSASNMISFNGFQVSTSFDDSSLGFRLASPVTVPEPSTCALALAGLACGGLLVRRRRRRA